MDTSALDDEDDEVCVETTQMTLCTEHSEDPDVKCVLQEGLYIDGKPVWACAPVVDPPPIDTEQSLPSSRARALAAAGSVLVLHGVVHDPEVILPV